MTKIDFEIARNIRPGTLCTYTWLDNGSSTIRRSIYVIVCNDYRGNIVIFRGNRMFETTHSWCRGDYIVDDKCLNRDGA